jgi:L-ascorbate metabolism protein UlaG (beta-lactamase superfamily)
MRSIFTRSLTALMIIGFFANHLAAGDKKAKCPVSEVHSLLKGVVHLSDDDIRFCTKEGINVFVDPVSGPNDTLVVKSGMVKPDLILITHAHEDHFRPAVIQEYLKLNPKAILAGPADVIKTAQENGITQTKVVVPEEKYTLAKIDFQTLPAYFSEGDSHPKSKQWVGYILNLNGNRYYITGDSGPFPQMAGSRIDVLFPLLSGCGGNMDLALEAAALTKARLVVPVHTDDQVETIKKYINKLPEGVFAAYYIRGNLIVKK